MISRSSIVTILVAILLASATFVDSVALWKKRQAGKHQGVKFKEVAAPPKKKKSKKDKPLFYRGFRVNVDAIPPSIDIPSDVSWDEFSNVKQLKVSAAFRIFRANWRGEEVVVKRLLTEEEEPRRGAWYEIEKEIKFLSRIQHPNIIKVLGAGDLPNPFAIIEYMGGGTLSQKLNYTRKAHPGYGKYKLPQAKALEFATKIASALDYMHNKWHPSVRLVHRDLKPDNIAFTADGESKIMDFGLCTLMRKTVQENVLLPFPGGIGTWKYMAPEVMLNKPYNQGADVYSFTMIFYHILTGVHPVPLHMNRTAQKKRMVREHWRPDLRPQWPVQLSRLIARGWSADTLVRPNFDEYLNVLRELQESGVNFDAPIKGGQVDGLITYVA